MGQACEEGRKFPPRAQCLLQDMILHSQPRRSPCGEWTKLQKQQGHLGTFLSLVQTLQWSIPGSGTSYQGAAASLLHLQPPEEAGAGRGALWRRSHLLGHCQAVGEALPEQTLCVCLPASNLHLTVGTAALPHCCWLTCCCWNAKGKYAYLTSIHHLDFH